MIDIQRLPAPEIRTFADAVPATDEYLRWGAVTGLLRRRWPTMLLVLVACIGGALLYARSTAPIYEAGAALQIEKDQYNYPAVVTDRSTDEGEISTQLEVLRSGPLANDVTRQLALNVALVGAKLPRSRYFSLIAVTDSTQPGRVTIARTGPDQYSITHSSGERRDSVQPGYPVWIAGTELTLRSSVASAVPLVLQVTSIPTGGAAFLRNLKSGRGDRNANIIWVRYRSPDPELAQQGVAVLTRQYIVNRADASKAKVQEAVRYLTQEADTLRRQMQSADLALQDFRQREGVISLADEATSAVTQGAQLHTARTTIEAERSALQQLVSQSDTGATVYRRLSAFPTLIGNPVVANLLRSVGELEGQRTQLLLQRTTRDPDVQAFDRRIADNDAQLRGITLTYLAGLQKQVASLDQAMSSQARVAASIPSKSMQEGQLSRTPRALADVYALVETRLQEARISESAANPGVSLVQPPEVPADPVWPRTSLLLAVGLAIGLLGGIGLAVLREGLDASIHSRQDVARSAELPVIAMVPHLGKLNEREGHHQSMLVPPASRTASLLSSGNRSVATLPATVRDGAGAVFEAYTWLETSLAFSHRGHGATVVAFTSPVAREGKTVSASNLAISAAQHGRRVLLIDADLRRGHIHELFDLAATPGLADVLAGRSSVTQAVQTVRLENGTSIRVMPRGQSSSHPTALLKSPALSAMIAEFRLQHDLVIIDSPPVNLVSDPLLLAGLVDEVILVARAGSTDGGSLSQAVRHLREVNAPVRGVLLNDIHLHRDSSYDDSYRYLEQAGAYTTSEVAS